MGEKEAHTKANPLKGDSENLRIARCRRKTIWDAVGV
jgi:hypothetical protein